jgi:hypothetical protein
MTNFDLLDASTVEKTKPKKAKATSIRQLVYKNCNAFAGQ